ncbi:hypothetical protein LINPERPRIM_LOCUS19811 [Linum perenne]
MQLPRWRNVLILKNSLIPALSQSKITTASIHSTPGLCGRWSNNGKSVNNDILKPYTGKFRRRDSCDEADSDDPESTFQAKFGNKWYTWSFNSSTSRGSKSESTHWTWRNLNDEERGNAKPESDEEEPPIVIGSCSDRRTLGLPLSGPLQIEEVKTAFRVSALKWHPDRHEGPSQAMAAEKFKLCVAAYKSLCSVLS